MDDGLIVALPMVVTTIAADRAFLFALGLAPLGALLRLAIG